MFFFSAFLSMQSLFRKLSRFVTQNYQQASQCALNQQITLRRGEVYPVKMCYHTLRVISGVAWLTQLGEDIVVEAGQFLLVAPGRESALVSALSREAVTFELS